MNQPSALNRPTAPAYQEDPAVLPAPQEVLDHIITTGIAQYEKQEHLRQGINRVLANGSFQVAYQPIFDIRTGHCLGVEALSRFASSLGPPEEVFEAAQRFGLSVELEGLVAKQVWPVVKAMPAGHFLALNLTPASLIALAGRPRRRAGLPLNRLVVEVTEHSQIPSYAALRKALSPLRESGMRVSIDDAGAGWASLRHIVELRPDFVKIDRSLIHGVARDHARLVAVGAFVMIAADIGADVVAEGIERSEDLAVLRTEGIAMVQGNLLGKPSTHPQSLQAWIPGLRCRAPMPRAS